jgi:hypothetical protein
MDNGEISLPVGIVRDASKWMLFLAFPPTEIFAVDEGEDEKEKAPVATILLSIYPPKEPDNPPVIFLLRSQWKPCLNVPY